MNARLLWYILILMVVACQPRPVITDAPPIREYTPAQQKSMAEAYQLPACEPLRIVIKDCQVLRDQVRPAH
jgi:hypothetical protein